MNAAQYTSYGDTSVVTVHWDAPTPTLKPGQILVAVHGASFNPFDGSMRRGMLQKMMPFAFPITAGGDFAGVVKVVSEGITDFTVGDEVYGSANVANGGSGSMAQEVAANVSNTSLKPKNATFEEAAALPLVATSAVQALEEHIKLQKGPAFANASAGRQKILIHGGAGGIGHIAIQLAKYLGAYVATTVRAKDAEFVRSLGADEVIDFTKDDFSVKLKKFDAVYDTVGGETLTKSFAILKKGGILLSMKGQPDAGLAAKFGVVGMGQGTKTNTQHLKRVAELVDGGHIRVHIDKVFPLVDVAAAWKYEEEGHPRGKVVVTVA